MRHPLIDEKSKYYGASGVQAIEVIESKLTLRECIGFARGNIFKYEIRKDYKGQKERDEEKIKKYASYLSFLEVLGRELKERDILSCVVDKVTVKQCYKILDLEVEY